jgi:hypothetical protein
MPSSSAGFGGFVRSRTVQGSCSCVSSVRRAPATVPRSGVKSVGTSMVAQTLDRVGIGTPSVQETRLRHSLRVPGRPCPIINVFDATRSRFSRTKYLLHGAGEEKGMADASNGGRPPPKASTFSFLFAVSLLACVHLLQCQEPIERPTMPIGLPSKLDRCGGA